MARIGELDSYLTETVKSGMVLVSREGPVDLHGMGDTVFGHFDPGTQGNAEKLWEGIDAGRKYVWSVGGYHTGKGVWCLHRTFVQQFAPGHPRDASVGKKV